MMLIYGILAALIKLTVAGDGIAACRKLCGGHVASGSNQLRMEKFGKETHLGLSKPVPEPCWRPLDLNGDSTDWLGSPIKHDDNGNPLYVVRFPQDTRYGIDNFGLYSPVENTVVPTEGYIFEQVQEFTPEPGMGIDVIYAYPGTLELTKQRADSIDSDSYINRPLLVGSANKSLCFPIIPPAYDESQIRLRNSVHVTKTDGNRRYCHALFTADVCERKGEILRIKQYYIVHNPLSRNPGPQPVKECSKGITGSNVDTSPNHHPALELEVPEESDFYEEGSGGKTVSREVPWLGPFYQMNDDQSKSRACWRDIAWAKPIPEVWNATVLIRGPRNWQRYPGYVTRVAEDYGVYFPFFLYWEPLAYSDNLASPNPTLELLYHREGEVVWRLTNSVEMKNNPPKNAIKLKSFQTNFQFLCRIDPADISTNLGKIYNTALGMVDATTGLCHALFGICDKDYEKRTIAAFSEFHVLCNSEMLGLEFEEPEEAPRCPAQF